MNDSPSLKRSRETFEADQSSVATNAAPLLSASDELAAALLQPTENGSEWQIKESRTKRRKAAKLEKNYPSITHSASARLQSFVKIGDLQNLVLWILADGTAPQWCSVRHHTSIKKVVVLMVPGLERGMFSGEIPFDDAPDVPERKEQDENGREEIHESETVNTSENGVGNIVDVSATKQSSPKPKLRIGPDDYYPVQLKETKVPGPLKPIAPLFDHIWPIKTPGEDRHAKMHSPLAAMLVSPIVKTKEEKKHKGPQFPPEGRRWKDQNIPVSSLVASVQDLAEDGYVLHPDHYKDTPRAQDEKLRRENNKTTTDDGWMDLPLTDISTSNGQNGSSESLHKDTDRKVLAMDCEMCLTSAKSAVSKIFSLTRISIIGWDGKTVLDKFVKPADPITDYLTPYSGITAANLEGVTTTLSDIQTELSQILTPETTLIGHSLNSDLNALHITFPNIIDTAMLFPHPRGSPLKSSLKWLAQKYLAREIQKGHGSTGHDSIEDARACLDLVKQKCEKGLTWGTSEASGESIFKRIGRASRNRRHGSKMGDEAEQDEHRISAVVDWGDPSRGYGGSADVTIGAESDAEIVAGIRHAVTGPATRQDSQLVGQIGKVAIPEGGCDFVWARMRELEAYRGWWSRSKSVDSNQLRTTTNDAASDLSLADVAFQAMTRVKEIYDSLPPCTAFIVYSGSGDPRDLQKMQELQKRFKEEYRIKKWDELSVKWTDTEEQELKAACDRARKGCGFVTVK